MAVDWYLVVW